MKLVLLDCTAAVALLFGALFLATRFRGRGRHRGTVRAARIAHTPRHTRTSLVRRGVPPVPAAAEYLPRHESDATGTPVVLGAYPDGDITLVHADPTVETRALIGASA